MKVFVIETATNELISSSIVDLWDFSGQLPSLTDGWRFNFKKHARNPLYETFVLICDNQSNEPQGCMIFEMKNKTEPFMAYIELAPHNLDRNKKYERVAACLIAYACRLSFIHGRNEFKGWLAFAVQEEDPENQHRLMAHYSRQYGAAPMDDGETMLIDPEQGEQLIDIYLTV